MIELIMFLKRPYIFKKICEGCDDLFIIASVECISIGSCERAFSIQTYIKLKFRDRFKTQHLESVLHIALERPERNMWITLGRG